MDNNGLCCSLHCISKTAHSFMLPEQPTISTFFLLQEPTVLTYKEISRKDLLQFFLKERQLNGDLVSKTCDLLWKRDELKYVDSEITCPNPQQPQAVMERENLDGFLKLTKTIDWITGNEIAPINNKVVIKDICEAHSEAQEELKRQIDASSRQEKKLNEVINKLQESKRESRLLMETLRSKLLITKVRQLKVGLLDVDIYGTSIPTMMKLSGKPEVSKVIVSHVLLEDMKRIPIENHGVKSLAPVVIIGFLAGNFYLASLNDFSDLLTSTLIVSIPQDITLIDTRRKAYMFCKVEVPKTKYVILHLSWFDCPLFYHILGVIEKMSCFKCTHCGEPSYIFGSGGARRTIDEMDIEFLGEVC
ncbi:hypothetical protein GIB67_023971 [Kingdonia uniflora]|uniref:Uncharacterized protein n=1 Tax=Kingdonia uniflora TaxID=39325 RepID=A0A7J7LPD4_9MAGN|nr:hypothetical protein GIB67_023971 [Kingdonia uniflora]